MSNARSVSSQWFRCSAPELRPLLSKIFARIGVFLSIVMIVAYFKVNEYGEAVGGLGKIDPIIALRES